jgi:hypothetical protein
VLITCWSAKGGSGTTVVAVTLALLAGRCAPTGALLVDLAGDVPGVLGVPDGDGPGVSDWLAAEDAVGPDALTRLEREVTPTLALLGRGSGAGARPGREAHLATALLDDGRPVVVDAGLGRDDTTLELIATATRSLLVLRPCYLALRRAVQTPLRPSGVVLVREAGRALGRRDVEAALGVPVKAEVDIDPAVARAVDAGLLATRLPRGLAHALRHAA